MNFHGQKFAGREDAVGEQRHNNEYGFYVKDFPATYLEWTVIMENELNSKSGTRLKASGLIQYIIGYHYW